MKPKKDNNLIRLTMENGNTHYFTSEYRAADYIGKQVYHVFKSLEKQVEIEWGKNREHTALFEIVDGTKVEYGQIN